ncbi:5-formyltetrahydrofolate cyclo-ligase [Sphingomonas sp. TZW2008]|uniref:5-formyltetrahydrofolate cyclo-ligase n=1 Tax=Sphingomonas sp. TZW2008 TaxID=1917973 RepID=UPI000A271FAB|nr:5-formyltetrahydrofolate cyclo-ligase [Sphingomonas sp. TZW2008]
MIDKQAIRRAARAARAALGDERPAFRVPASFRALLAPDLTVASYKPIGGEADPAPLHEAARAAGCTLALPYVVDKVTPLRFLTWQIGQTLSVGPFGLSQPTDSAAPVAPDIILTPLVAFDRRLSRLGQGAGHYDRAFAAYPNARRIGIAFAVQHVEHIPTDPWDVPLHAIITENDWIEA